MRTKKSMINMIVGIGGQLLTLLITMLNRIALAHYLSAGYLGVNGLFTNILGILSMAELGFGGAMVFSMYKPAAEGDEDMLIRLMNLYKKIYHWVTIVVMVLGLALYPFLGYLIKDTAGVEHLHLIYLMYLASTVASYMFGYKSSMLLVNQRNYVQLVYTYVVQTVQAVVQIIILITLRSYMFYLTVQIVCSILINILVAIRVDKDYPYLGRHSELPSKEMQRSIWKNVYAMSAHKFGTIIVNATDNLIMSAFVGLSSVGIYSNYSMIVNCLGNFLQKFVAAFKGSVGNLGATESSEYVYEIYRQLDLLMFLCGGYASAGIFVLSNPFIEEFFGKEYLFSMSIVFVIAAKTYLSWMRQVTLTFKDAMGLFWHDRYKAVIEALINLVVSIALVYKYEIVGIFVGTIISTLTTCFWVEPYVLMRYGIKDGWQAKLRAYFIEYIKKTAVMVAGTAAAYYICGLLPQSGLLWLIIKGVVCTVVYNCMVFAVYWRDPDFVALKERGIIMLRRFIKKRRAKKERAPQQ